MSQHVAYPFPLRPDFLVRMWLPADVTDGELEHLIAYLRALKQHPDVHPIRQTLELTESEAGLGEAGLRARGSL